MPYKTALGFLEYTKNETDKMAWRAVKHNVEYIKNMLNKTPAYEPFKVRRHVAGGEEMALDTILNINLWLV